MSHGNHDLCECSHRYPEHSMFGTCRGCLDCDDSVPRSDDTDVDVDEDEDDHPYRQCECRQFRLAQKGVEEQIA